MANEVRLIDANALREKAKWMKDQFGLPIRAIQISELGVAPTIDPKTLRPKGRWNVDVANLKATCSECGIVLRFTDEMQISTLRDLERFCYYCGADMRGDSE